MEKKIIEKPYNIGLDIGTSSVGWAVLDSDSFKVVKKVTKKIIVDGEQKGVQKALWGVRLFESAESAKSRRVKRATRRRYDRRRARIKLLQRLFSEEINKVDSQFFTKLKETFFNEKDAKNKTIKLTKEEKEAIKQYCKKYPTIYHLREELIKNLDKKDIRLVYLAIHHIIKYRGNFLYENERFNTNDLNIKEKLEEIFSSFPNYTESFSIEIFENIDYSNLENILLINSKKDKKEELKKELEAFLPKKMATSFLNALMGYKFSLNNMFDIELEKEEKTKFEGSEYEDSIDELTKVIPEKIEFVNALKELYDMVFLKILFKDTEEPLISSLMIEKYNVHQNNLKLIKTLLSYDREEYTKFFKTKKEDKQDEKNKKDKKCCLYEQYMQNPNTNFDNKKLKEVLKETLSKIANKIEDTKLLEKYNELKENLESENYVVFPKITDTDNGKFPYQLNKEELIRIIENQGKYYPFLLEKVNDKYKLVKLLEFRIPYYVGPLHNYSNNYKIENPNMWMVRKQDGKLIDPFNFEDVVDINASAEKFITRMISNCTYLLDEPAIPANSILYSKFKVLNELKQIKVDDQKLTVEQQNDIYNNLFLKETGIITNEKFTSYLRQKNHFNPYPELKITGYSSKDRFANSMQPYIDFFGENGIFKNTNYKEEDAEDIIRLITIFEDKKILKEKIKVNYDLSDEAINKILSKKYKGWSNLSKKLLTDIYYQDEITKEYKNIITLMEETEENFMQILHNKKYKFQEKIDEINNKKTTSKLSYELVQNLVTSPATKRGIYQALKIVDEIVGFMGYEPKYISLEMARGDEKKERKDSRKEKLLEIYKAIKKDVENYNELYSKLNSYEKINSKRLYLYFLQLGRCLYSGEKIEIEDLNDSNKYEIDHIIPRTLIKDDSIDNLALVKKETNQKKAASFVVPWEYRNQSSVFWNQLHKLGLISINKLNRLRRNEYKDSDIEGFINRQLVETRQISKHVANILKKLYPKSNIIYLHANLSSDYREKFKLYKFREINDYHHAHDAYLATVLGQYKEEYLNMIKFSKLKEINNDYYNDKQYKYGYVVNSLKDGLQHVSKETGEILETSNLNKIIKNTLYRNDILVTKKTEFGTGEFYNQTLRPKTSKNIEKKIELKKNLPVNWYGYYDNLNKAYTIVVKYNEKNKEVNKMLGIPIHIYMQSKNNSNLIKDYIKKALGLKDNTNFDIIKNKIPFNTLLNWEGKLCYLVGAGEGIVEVCNATQFHIEKEKMERWKEAFHRLFNSHSKVIDDVNYNIRLGEIIDYIIEKMDKYYSIYNNEIIKLKEWAKFKNTNVLSIEQKENIIKQIFKMLRANSETANFKFLGQSDRFGRIKDKNISSAKIIHQSITGIWVTEDEF